MKRYGFTLVELSIVLVIIGLVIGGVLVGRDLIYAASVQSQIKQMQEMELGIKTFRLKYNCMAGDCDNATALFGTSFNGNTISNGDNDGMIRVNTNSKDCVYSNASAGGGEVLQMLLHLNAAGLGKYTADGVSSGVGTGIPRTVLNANGGIHVTCNTPGISGWFVSSWSTPFPSYSRFFNSNILVVGVSGVSDNREGYALSWVYAGPNATIPADAAGAIDQKIDDGNRNTGLVGAMSNSLATSATGVTCFTGTTDYAAPTTCGVVLGKKLD